MAYVGYNVTAAADVCRREGVSLWQNSIIQENLNINIRAAKWKEWPGKQLSRNNAVMSRVLWRTHTDQHSILQMVKLIVCSSTWQYDCLQSEMMVAWNALPPALVVTDARVATTATHVAYIQLRKVLSRESDLSYPGNLSKTHRLLLVRLNRAREEIIKLMMDKKDKRVQSY